MNSRLNQPADDPDNLQHFLGILDRLEKAGFVKEHSHREDAHMVGFTKRGWALIRELQAIEAAGPPLSDKDRRIIYGILRTAKRLGSG